jgi:hypothetical protein
MATVYKIQRGLDAKNAGKVNRSPCTLYITNDNTRFVFNNNLRLGRYNRNTDGVLTLGDTKWEDLKDPFDLERNIDVQDLKIMVGLRYHSELESFYLDPNNLKHLRYDKIVLMTDNQQLISLVTNYFNRYAPSLVKQNFIVHYRDFYTKTQSLHSKL